MRPQRFSCGVKRNWRRPIGGRRSFNEAAAFQLRSHRCRYVVVLPIACFNEAAAFQLRSRGQ